jgi:hypothetical protein
MADSYPNPGERKSDHLREIKQRLHGFFARFLRACARFHFSLRFTSSSFETLNILLAALLNLSASVSPGMFGAGAGFIVPPS